MKKLILIGGGGHCKSCINAIELMDNVMIEGILDVPERVGETVLGYPIVGTDDEFAQWVETDHEFLITLGQIKSAARRVAIFDQIKIMGGQFATLISPYAVVSRHAQIGEGTIILNRAVVNAGAKIGENCIINTGAIVEHDTIVHSHTHLSTGAILNGEVEIGKECFIGSNCTVFHSISVTQRVILGAGSLVSHDIITPGTYIGQPAHRTQSL